MSSFYFFSFVLIVSSLISDFNYLIFSLFSYSTQCEKFPYYSTFLLHTFCFKCNILARLLFSSNIDVITTLIFSIFSSSYSLNFYSSTSDESLVVNLELSYSRIETFFLLSDTLLSKWGYFKLHFNFLVSICFIYYSCSFALLLWKEYNNYSVLFTTFFVLKISSSICFYLSKVVL